MPEQKRRRKTEATTSAPLTTPPALQKEDPVEHLLKVLFQLGLEGNVQAARLYLDTLAKKSDEEPVGLTADDALKLLQQHA